MLENLWANGATAALFGLRARLFLFSLPFIPLSLFFIPLSLRSFLASP
jgi:hypothetical protein